MVQAAGNLHHPIRDARFGQAQDIFDDPTPFEARNRVFDHHTRAGDDPIEQPFPHAQLLALGLFGGC
jgi:hypothetical protein